MWKARRSSATTPHFSYADYDRCYENLYSYDCFASFSLSLADATDPGAAYSISENFVFHNLMPLPLLITWPYYLLNWLYIQFVLLIQPDVDYPLLPPSANEDYLNLSQAA